MEPDHLERTISYLRASGVEFDPGLSDEEVVEVESAFGFRFPPDLRALLQAALPISEGFPDWRKGSRKDLRERLGWPVEGVCFDVEHNDLWPEHWGQRPQETSDALLLVRRTLSAAPILVPVYSHRYVPDRPHSSGNPVFSVVQLDIIRYGRDLSSYLGAEFGFPVPNIPSGPSRHIDLWDRLVLDN